ncbi:hypothetical protein ACQHIV_01030 [Kribbella sp. GL6]|uniref:hypothetical protein n=1 Tax=Kribbella sp. GL6 TaxID=3419765 RepID=UPI003CFF702E
MITTPPELRPETRARQRAELTAIVAREATRKPRNHAVPVLAAAAVVAVVAGLAIGIPALRQDGAPAPAAVPAHPGSQAIAPLNAADRNPLGALCAERVATVARTKSHQVLDGFRYTDPPSGAFSTTWVVIRIEGFWASCGFDAKGNLNAMLPASPRQPLLHAVELKGAGTGLYAAHIKRITVALPGQAPVQAVLRNGYFYTALPYVRVRGPRTDSAVRPYTVRGYDANGKLVYTSPRTDGEVRAGFDRCYVGPDGKIVGFGTAGAHPDPKTCLRSYIWRYQPN